MTSGAEKAEGESDSEEEGDKEKEPPKMDKDGNPIAGKAPGAPGRTVQVENYFQCSTLSAIIFSFFSTNKMSKQNTLNSGAKTGRRTERDGSGYC